MSGSVSYEARPGAPLPHHDARDASLLNASGQLAPAGWTVMRAIIIMLCFGVNMVDGVDVLMISYVAPTLSKSLGLSAEQLGIVFSAGLAGMALGGLLIAPLSDKTGRRPLIIFSVALMSVCMIASGYATSLVELAVLRLGVGA
ncbi:MAG: MFS transporter, partial [Gluconacetobacter sp.]